MGALGTLGRLFGGGKAEQPRQSGYQTLHDLFGDFTRKTLPQEVIAQHNLPRTRQLFRPLSDAEMADPIFRPQALMDMGAQLSAGGGAEGDTGGDGEDDAANKAAGATDTLRLLMAMRGNAMPGTKQTRLADSLLADGEKFSELSQFLAGKKARAGTGNMAGSITDERGAPIRGLAELLSGRM